MPRLRSYLRCALRFALAAVMCVFWSQGAGASDGGTIGGEVLVKLRSTQALASLLAKYPLSVIDQFGRRPIYRLEVTGNANVKDTIAALLLEVDVLLAEPNVRQGSPESRRNVVWAIGNPESYTAQWAPTALRLDDAHRLATGAGVRVAVLDTGVDRRHPALAGRLLPGFDFVDYDDDPSEEGTEDDLAYGHGTHVAGLIALAAPDAMIMPVRVLDPDGEGNAWVLAEALLYAIDPDGDPNTDDGAHVVNLSLGTATRTRIFSAIADIATCSAVFDEELADPGYDDDAQRCGRTHGVIIAAAAGNDGSSAVLEYPAAESSVHGLAAVGASAPNSRRASFTNYGSWVRFAAPGDGITSSIPGGGYGTWSGTSMATPLFAGTAALLREQNPTMKPDDILRRIGSRSAALCGTNLRQIDASAALRNVNPPNTVCR